MISPILQRTFDFYGSYAMRARSATAPIDNVDYVTERELYLIKALFGYVKREGVFGKIFMVIHRIWNSVKALFGQSDWQKGRRAVFLIAKRLLPNITDLKIAEKFKNLTEKKVSFFLERCIDGVNALNKALKPFEGSFFPLFDQYLSATESINIDPAELWRSISQVESIEMLADVILQEESPSNPLVREQVRQMIPFMVPSINAALVNKGFPIELLTHA